LRITAKGQVTIPERLRRQAGLLPGMEVAFVHDAKGVRIERAPGGRRTRRQADVREALERLRGSATVRMTTEEIMALTRD
jgi:bifunctional DNA-binding transcriptional regulator/antitoxin component of YhaV-PrlF toxin-antitoxin module